MHWIWHQRETREWIPRPDAEGRGRWAVLQFFTCPVWWVWLHCFFQQWPHLSQDPRTETFQSKQCIFQCPWVTLGSLFVSEKNVGVNCTLSRAYLWQEREISGHRLKVRKSLPVRGHTLWGGCGGGRQSRASEGRWSVGLQSSRSKKSKQKLKLMNWPG